jgi:TM2 domain-containing membrane protein YozV
MRSNKSYGVAVFLVVFFGWVGAHRFYADRWVTATLQALTLGGLGVWWMVDIFVVALGGLTDATRRPIRWA